MSRKTLSLITPLAASVLLIGLQAASHASNHSNGKILFSGNVTMPDNTLVRIYVASTVKVKHHQAGTVYGEIGLIGPDGKVISFATGGGGENGEVFTSGTTASLTGTLTFTAVKNGNTYQVPSAITTNMTKDDQLGVQSLGWLVVSTDNSQNAEFPAGTVLWTSGVNKDGTIFQLDLAGISTLIPPK